MTHISLVEVNNPDNSVSQSIDPNGKAVIRQNNDTVFVRQTPKSFKVTWITPDSEFPTRFEAKSETGTLTIQLPQSRHQLLIVR